ncbi:MAG: hypothetical protein P4N41_15665 [Negativicutes bacterium]|nr:hypothetical protein [Negativicutes bacterium]
MKNYCGKNGCYDFFLDEDSQELVLAIYLNSSRIYEYNDKGNCVFTMPPDRKTADIDITFTGDEQAVPFKIRIFHFTEEGICQFVRELMQTKDELDSKDGITDVVTQLLDRQHAPWGVVPDETGGEVSH